jgi:peptide/nickel transport system permease protein
VLGYLLKRLGYYAVLLAVAVGVSYALASTSLSPRGYFENRHPRPTQSSVEAQLTDIGINDHTPLLNRFGSWVGNAFQGDFGTSITGTSINSEFLPRIGVSLRLLIIGTILGVTIGILVGAWGAVRQYKFSDRFMTIFSFVVMAMPVFLIGVLFKIGATWLNDQTDSNFLQFTGEKSATFEGGFFAMLQDRGVHLLLPTLAIAVSAIAIYSRYQRNTMLDVLGSDYLRTARAKGLSRNRALLKHGLRTALIPMSTFFAYGFLGLFTGSTFTEVIFGWNGMGTWLVQSISRSDINAVTAFSLFAGVMVLASGFIADTLHAALDPRVRHA